MRIEFDTDMDARHPVYTRANAGEVLPRIVPPLGWTLIGPVFEAAFRGSFERDCGATRAPAEGYHYTGRLVGRFVLNLTFMRTAGAHLVGTSPADVDRQYFGEASEHGLPPYQSSWIDPLWYLRSGPSMGWTLATLDRRVRKEREAAVAGAAEGRRLLDSDAGDAVLVARLRELMTAFAAAGRTHVTARALTSPALALVDRAATRAHEEPGFAVRALGDLPGLESGEPSRALAKLAASVQRESAAADAVRGGATLREMHSAAPVLALELDRFVERFGHRGVNEFDPTSASWEQDPDSVVVLLAAAMGAERTPGAAPVAKVDGRLLGALVGNAKKAMLRGERTKTTAVLITNEMRRVLYTLRRRWADRVDGDELWLCSLAEVEAMAQGAPPPADAITRRRKELEEAASVDLPEVIDGVVTVIPRGAAARAVGDDVLTGIGGSPGVVEGRVRVMDDPFGDFEPGDILVAAVTDTAWTPLFLSAGAVITDVGGVLSHATIVARDLGIPAVINTKSGTVALRTGDRVAVDGSAGTVRLLEAAP